MQLSCTDRRRPAVILTRQNAIPRLNALTVAPITSTVRASPAYVTLSIEDGLFGDCAVNCDQLATVPKGDLDEFITTLTPEKLQKVHEAIVYALSLD